MLCLQAWNLSRLKVEVSQEDQFFYINVLKSHPAVMHFMMNWKEST